MAYNFTTKHTSERGHTAQIDPVALYGYWEWNDGTEGGGLWFTRHENGGLELVDYDGAACLPRSLVVTLCECGYINPSDAQSYF